jgi:hypothetical protein
MLRTLTVVTVLCIASAYGLNIGYYRGDPINQAGRLSSSLPTHNIIDFGPTPPTAAQISSNNLDIVFSDRGDGSADLNNWIMNGGVLISEILLCSIIDKGYPCAGGPSAFDIAPCVCSSYASVGPDATFLPDGIADGFAAGLPNNFGDSSNMNVFSSYSDTGGMDEILRSTVSGNTCSLYGSVGDGCVFILGFNYLDSAANSDEIQYLNNVVNVVSTCAQGGA